MVGKLLLPEIKSLIDARDFGALRELFREWPPADLAEVIVDMPENDRVIIFRVLPAALAADVFEYLDVDAQQELLRRDGARAGGRDPQRNVAGRSHGVARRNAERGRTPINQAPHAGRTQGRYRAAWLSEDSVGRLMTPDFIAVQDDWTVQRRARLRSRERSGQRNLECYLRCR